MFTQQHWKLRRDPTFEEADELFKKGGGGFGFISWFSIVVLFYLTFLVVPTFCYHFYII
jgi:hypothetical protein